MPHPVSSINLAAWLQQQCQTLPELNPREAERLFYITLNHDRAWWLAHRTDALHTLGPNEAALLATIADLLQQRAQGAPMAYLLDSCEFYGRKFHVNPDVLIPRPETEELIAALLAWLNQKANQEATPKSNFDPSQAPRQETNQTALQVLDIGCGSGVIGLTLALELPQAQVTAVDICPRALAVTTQNLHALAQRYPSSKLLERFKPQLSDYTQSVQNQRFDLIVTNPPYIALHDAHLKQGDLRFEPQHALTDGNDGLTAYRHLAEHADRLLNPSGSLWVEHGYDQQPSIQTIFAHMSEPSPWCSIEVGRDLAGQPRWLAWQTQASTCNKHPS